MTRFFLVKKEQKWRLRTGKAVDVGVGADGVVFIVDDQGQAHRWVGKRFKKGERLGLKRISVGRGAHVWATGTQSSIWELVDLSQRTWHYARLDYSQVQGFLNGLQPRHDGLRIISDPTEHIEAEFHVWARKDLAGTRWSPKTTNRYFLQGPRPELNIGQLAIAELWFRPSGVQTSFLENRVGRPIDAATAPHKWHFMKFNRKQTGWKSRWKISLIPTDREMPPGFRAPTNPSIQN